MEQQERTFRIGPIRPPSEANSLLLQVTNGCTWNKCKFCQLYRHTKFKAYSADSIKADIDNIAYQADIIRRYQTPLGAWDIDGLNQELGQIPSEEERQCFYMVANWLVGGGENVFLQDGNTTALSSGRLSDVLIYLKQAFPGDQADHIIWTCRKSVAGQRRRICRAEGSRAGSYPFRF